MLADAWFRARLPCLTISVMSDNADFIREIPTHILEVLVTSKRILSCVPSKNLETLLSQQVGLSRVSLLSLITSFSKMPRNKLSLKVMRLMIMKQVKAVETLCSNVHYILRDQVLQRGLSSVNDHKIFVS